MSRLRLPLAAFFLAFASAASALPVAAPSAADRDQLMTLPEYRKGLKELRGHFEKRGEDPAVAERYVADLEGAFPVQLGEKVPVTKGTFEAFLKYQAAWARKTRDGKNPLVAPAQQGHEVDRARQLKAAFKSEAELKSPRFYQAFQTAVRDVRALRRRGAQDYAGVSAVFFGDQVDDSYTHVDAGDEALEKGDHATAIREANMALAANPANADALVLRAGAEYDSGRTAAAVSDAQAALMLDPVNPSAQAILSLTSSGGDAAKSAATTATTGSAGLDDGRSARALPTIVAGAETPAPGVQRLGSVRLAAPPPPAPSATPAVGRILAEDLSVLAVERARKDPVGSMGRLGQAMALDPGNAAARDWHSTIANRNGDYSAALGSAERSITSDPNDAVAYYNKARALAGAGDKQGSLEALTMASRVDPSYSKMVAEASAISETEQLDLLFQTAAYQRQPADPLPRHASSPLMLVIGAVGALLALAGAAVFFADGGAKGPAIVRR